MKRARLGSGCGQLGSELLHVDGDDIENLPFGLFDGRRRFALERINVRALPFIDHVARPLRRAFAEVLLRSEEHTSELQSLMRISYAVFCLKKKKQHIHYYEHNTESIQPIIQKQTE